MRLYRDSVAVLRAELVDTDYGQARDWDNARTVYTLRASVQPVRDERPHDARDPDRETAFTIYRVYTPGQIDIRASDRIRYGGLVFEVIGSSLVWSAATGRNAYTLAIVRRLDG